MTNRYQDEVRRIVESMKNEDRESQDRAETPDQEREPEITIHRHYFPDAIVTIYPLQERYKGQVVESTPVLPENAHIIDSEPAKPPVSVKQTFDFVTLYIVLLCCIPMLASIIFQAYLLQNPSIATVTIIPKSQTVTTIGTLQRGRVLHPITLGESQAVPTTGTGHQDAKASTGYFTFYNGSFTAQTIDAGTVFTGSDGIQVVTYETLTIPPDTPPVNGQATGAAHAINSGSAGNIQALDINTTISSAVFVKNLTAFAGGQDERDFQTVAKRDIDTTATQLKTAVIQSMQGALQGQLKQGEALQLLPCRPTVTSDHPLGAEATRVKVTVSQTCSAVAFNIQALTEKVTLLLSSQAQQQSGTGYSLFGNTQVSVTTSPGVERAAICFTGIGDATRLPRQVSLIHLAFLVM